LFLALALRSGRDFDVNIFWGHFLPFTFIYFSWLIIFYIFGLYEFTFSNKGPLFYSTFIAALAVCLVAGITLFYSLPLLGISPKTNLLLHISIFGLLAFAFRQWLYHLFLNKFQARVAIIGQNPQTKELIDFINGNPQIGYKMIEHIKDDDDIYKKIKEKKIEILILAENINPGSELTKDLCKCLPLKINIIDLAKAYEIICGKIPLSFVSQVWFLENLNEREKYFYENTKYLMDIAGAGLITAAAMPLLLLIGLAIKLEDGGPIFYLQKRVGKDKKTFSLIKFRSMIIDAEKNGAVWAQNKDPRATRIGKILRSSHLDEMPQMINVFKGEISLVGPRPERPEFVEKLEKTVPHYNLRHLIKPGFTGWAQINFRYGRSVMDSFEKFQYDLYYLKNRSFFLDFLVLLKTFNLLLRRE
jgi:exopolysaccharide biosynthesis polyprenyl glycosylphosphotransferase